MPPRVNITRDAIPHATQKGYQWHLGLGDTAQDCEECGCAQANRAYHRTRRLGLKEEPGGLTMPEEATNDLTERRKADRGKMALRLVDLAKRYGITASVTSGEHERPRAVFVNLEGPHGLRLTVAFDGNSPQSEPDTYVLNWHGVEDGWQLNPDAFSGVNPYHGHKATDIVHGFANLHDVLDRRFSAIRDDTAFTPALHDEGN